MPHIISRYGLWLAASCLWGIVGVVPAMEPADAPAQAPPATPEATPADAQSLEGPRVAGLPLQLPEPPRGYASRAEIIARIGLGNIRLIDLENDRLPAGVRELKAIPYGQGGEKVLELDLHLPADPSGPRPGLIFIHGGAWSGGDRSIYHYYTRRLAQQGYAAATISYRLSGVAPFPAALHDCKCAVRWMRANAAQYGIDADRIAVLGGSAGGHLAMMVGYCSDPELEGDGGNPAVSSHVAAVVNFYGPSDLTTEAARQADPVRRFLGGNFDDRAPLYAQASPVTHLNPGDPPTLIIHGTLDELVDIDQSDRLARQLQTLKIPFAYDRLAGWPHTLDMAADVNQHCLEVMSAFLQATLQPTP